MLAKIENAETLTTRAHIRVDQLFNEVVQSHTDYAANNHLRLQVQVHPAGLTIVGDHFLMYQAIANLVKNAIEHAHTDSDVTLASDTNDGQVTLSVRNAGDPIPDYAIDKLFDRFYSLPNRKGQKGSGIGLSFVREVAKLHEGVVTISNEKIGNVCATFTTPRA